MARDRPARPSIADVAAAAQVSVGTVSNALNRPEKVRPATRQRIEAAIAELGFAPNGSARRLRTGSLTAVGVVVLDVRNPFFTEMARGIEDQVEDRGWTLMLASSDQRVEREQRALDLFTEHGVAGVIAVPASEDLTALERLESRGTPVVLLDHPSPSAQLPSVAVDNVSGGRLAAAHLFGQGHRQLVMFNGPHSVRQCRDRWEGALAAAVGAGLDPAESVSQVLLDSMDIEGGAEAGRQWLAAHGGRQPEAVFCVNDLVGIGLQRALREAGFDPARSAIVGYDDTDLAREIALPLTSVVQPTYEMGRRAAGLLLQVRAQGVVEHVVFQPELVIRASSSPPGQS